MTRVRIRHLSTTTTDPNKAGEKMLEAVKENIKMTKRVTALNLLKGLKQRRCGTAAIEKAAKLLVDDEVRD